MYGMIAASSQYRSCAAIGRGSEGGKNALRLSTLGKRKPNVNMSRATGTNWAIARLLGGSLDFLQRLLNQYEVPSSDQALIIHSRDDFHLRPFHRIRFSRLRSPASNWQAIYYSFGPPRTCGDPCDRGCKVRFPTYSNIRSQRHEQLLLLAYNTYAAHIRCFVVTV